MQASTRTELFFSSGAPVAVPVALPNDAGLYKRAAAHHTYAIVVVLHSSSSSRRRLKHAARDQHQLRPQNIVAVRTAVH
jgi:hypothetical protein